MSIIDFTNSYLALTTKYSTQKKTFICKKASPKMSKLGEISELMGGKFPVIKSFGLLFLLFCHGTYCQVLPRTYTIYMQGVLYFWLQFPLSLAFFIASHRLLFLALGEDVELNVM